MIYDCDSSRIIVIPFLPAGMMDRPWYLPFLLLSLTDHDLWQWLFLDHYDTFPSSWCDGQAMIPSLRANLMDRPYLPFQSVWWTGHDTFRSCWCDGHTMIYDYGSSWIMMIPSHLAGVMDRPWSMIVALPGSLWYIPLQLVWWTGHDLWLWLFLDTYPSSWCDEHAMIYDYGSSWIIMRHSLPAGVMILMLSESHDLWLCPFMDQYDTFPSSWCDGQTMIYDCDSSRIIMIPSLPAGVMDRPQYLPFQLVWWADHDLWLWLLLDHYDSFPSSWRDGQTMIYNCDSSWVIMMPSLPAAVMDRPWSMIVTLPGSSWHLPFELVWWTGHDTFPSNWCDGQTMIYDFGSCWIIMIASLPAGEMDRPWSNIVTLPDSLWYRPFQLVWLTSHDTFPSTGHDLWIWLFLDYYDTFPSSWCDGQAMIYNFGSTWIIIIPSLPAGVMDRPWYLPFELIWWTGHDLWLWLFLDHYDTFSSS